MDIYSLGLGLSADGALVGVQQFKGALADAAQAAQTTGEKAGTNFGTGFSAKARGLAMDAAKQHLTAFQAAYEADQARISEGLARGFITPEQARAAGREAAQQYNVGLLTTLDQLGAKGLNASNNAQYRELASSLKSVSGAQEQAAASAGVHGLQLGRLNQEIGTFIGRLTGSNTALTRLGAQVGGAVAGYGLMVAGLVAVSGVLWVYDKLTEDAKKAQAAQDELTQSLREWYRTQQDGASGARQREVNATASEITQLQAQIADLRAEQQAPSFGAGKGVDDTHQAGIQAAIDQLTKKIQDDRAAIVAANADIITSNAHALTEFESQQSARLASLIRTNQATAAERARALQVIREDQAIIQAYTADAAGASGAQLAALQHVRAELASQVATLQSAFVQGARTGTNATGSAGAGGAATGDIAAALAGLAKQYDELVKVNEQDNIQNAQTEKAIALNGILGGQRQITEAYYDAQIQRLQALNTLSGPALTERLQQIDATERSTVAIGAQNKAQDEATQLAATGVEIGKLVNAQAAADIELTKKQTKETADQIKAQQQLAATIAGDVVQAFDTLSRHGVLSFDDISRAVEQLTARLIKLPGISAETAKQLGVLNIGIASAGAGFGLGSQAGMSLGGGAVGGAAQGIAAGSQFGVTGMVIGGLSGAIGGLLGAANAHKEAAAALKQAADSFNKGANNYINGNQGGVAGQLAQNADTAQQLIQQWQQLFNQAVKLGRGATQSFLDNNPNPTSITAGETANAATIKQNFFDSIDAQLRALRGPAGDYENQLVALGKSYQENWKDALAAGASTEQLADVTKLYQESLDKVKAAEAERLRSQAANLQLGIESAQADSLMAREKLARDQLAEQQAEELAAAIANGADAATQAQLAYKDSLEQSALAAQQAAERIQAAFSDFQRDVSFLGLSGPGAIDQEKQFLGFAGLTDDQIRALYVSATPGAPLTDAQEQLDNAIVQYFQDVGKLNPASGGAGAGLASGAASSGKDVGSVTQISAAQATSLLSLGQTQNYYLAAIEQHTRRLEIFQGADAARAASSGLNGIGGFSGFGGGDVIVVLQGADAAAMVGLLRSNASVAAALDGANGKQFVRNRASSGEPRQ